MTERFNASVLLVGCGSIGRRHARVLRSLGIDDLRICDPLAGARAALAAETPVTRQYASFAEALREPCDAAFILTPPDTHVALSIEALRAGCHVFCEKPLAYGMDDVELLEQVIEQTGRRFMVGFCFRYHEGLALAKHFLEAGRIGGLVAMRLRMSEHLPEVRPDYRLLFTLQRGGAFDLTHEIDLACWFAGGQRIRDVRSLSGALSGLGFTAPDVADILIDFDGRCLANIHLDFFSHPRQRCTELLGTTGTILVEFAAWDHCVVRLYEASRRQWVVENLATDRDHMFRGEDRDFLAAITRGGAVPIDLAEARRSLEILCRAYPQV